MPDWSPVRTLRRLCRLGRHRRGRADAGSVLRNAAAACACANDCNVHGHQHATAWSSKLPIADLKSFWGALGCACWAV